MLNNFGNLFLQGSLAAPQWPFLSFSNAWVGWDRSVRLYRYNARVTLQQDSTGSNPSYGLYRYLSDYTYGLLSQVLNYFLFARCVERRRLPVLTLYNISTFLLLEWRQWDQIEWPRAGFYFWLDLSFGWKAFELWRVVKFKFKIVWPPCNERVTLFGNRK
jgi:hypothetical protein